MKHIIHVLVFIIATARLQVPAESAPVLPDPFDMRRIERTAPDKPQGQNGLEHFELQQLRMVGTLKSRLRHVALIQDPAQRIYLVSVGSPVGPDQGVVEHIGPYELLIRESVTDPQGLAHERKTRLRLDVP